MFPKLPTDVTAYIKKVFATANRRVTALLGQYPTTHEEQLDFQLIASLNRQQSVLLPKSGAAVVIETHWLGGRRHFYNWEIADIAIIVVVRNTGRLVARKVALFQSKRLFADGPSQTELELADYISGVGRIADRTERLLPAFDQRPFSFTVDSRYREIKAQSKQTHRIDRYARERNVPVFYCLYHPPEVPFSGAIPPSTKVRTNLSPKLGCRVMPATDVHARLAKLPKGSRPKFRQLGLPSGKGYASHGLRLETFVGEMLACRQGRLFEDARDPDLAMLLYGRTGPLASAIVVTIDLPQD